MKRLLSFLLLTVLVWAAPLAATTVTGTFNLPNGTGVNGTIFFKLDARRTGGGVVYLGQEVSCTILSGTIASGCTVQGNDTLTPDNTWYSVRVVDLNNRVILSPVAVPITGASFDMGSASFLANPSLLAAGDVTHPGNVTVQGNLTVDGTVNFGLQSITSTASGPSAVAFIAKGAAAQTANIFEVQNSAGGVLFSVSSTGFLGKIGINRAPLSTTSLLVSQDATDAWSGAQIRVTGISDTNKWLTLGFHTTEDYGFIQAGRAGTGWNSISLNSLGGNVGIGLTNPDTLLQVKGSGKFKNSADSSLNLILDSGSTTAQNIDMPWRDRGTNVAILRKTTANSIVLLADNGFTTRSLANVQRVLIHGTADKISLGSAADASIVRVAPDQIGINNSLILANVSGGGAYVEFLEQSPDPTAAPVNRGRLFAKDNGSGKTQLCVIFNTGAVQCFATQP